MGLGAGPASPVKGEGIKASPRLIGAAKLLAMERATSRKALRLEGVEASSGRSERLWSRKKVITKTASCGVKLSGNEAEELRKFLARG